MNNKFFIILFFLIYLQNYSYGISRKYFFYKNTSHFITRDSLVDSLKYFGNFNYGLTLSAGRVFANSSVVPKGHHHFKNGGAMGLYFQFPFSNKLFAYVSVGIANRGYLIKFNKKNDNSLYFRSDKTEGYKNLLYIDKIKCLGYNINNKLSFYLGINTTIKIKEKTYYNLTTTLTPKDSAKQKPTSIVYPTYQSNGNGSFNFFELALVAGIRFEVYKSYSVSFRYMRDIFKLNNNSEGLLKNELINSSFI